MEQAVYINVCIRKNESRTKRIAEPLMRELSKRYVIKEIDLTESDLQPVTVQRYIQRSIGDYHPSIIQAAEAVASAERIIIACPFWDMSFPSVLKVFCENISISGITFKNNDNGTTKGNCKASKLLLITTRGMNIEDESELDQGSSYLKALCWLWGIPEFKVISSNGLDLCDEKQQNQLIEKAITKGLKICEDF